MALVKPLTAVVGKLHHGLDIDFSSVETLEGLKENGGPLRKFHRKIVPHSVLNRNIKVEWRHLHSIFGGVVS